MFLCLGGLSLSLLASITLSGQQVEANSVYVTFISAAVSLVIASILCRRAVDANQPSRAVFSVTTSGLAMLLMLVGAADVAYWAMMDRESRIQAITRDYYERLSHLHKSLQKLPDVQTRLLAAARSDSDRAAALEKVRKDRQRLGAMISLATKEYNERRQRLE